MSNNYKKTTSVFPSEVEKVFLLTIGVSFYLSKLYYQVV